MKILLFAVALFTVAGCATAPVTTSGRTLFRAPPIHIASSSTDVDSALFSTLADCQTVLTGLEKQATQLKWWGVGLQTAGGLLGSVFLPMAVVANASKLWIAFLGSSAGFANTEISVIRNEGLGAADVIRTRANVQANMQTALVKYYAEKSSPTPNIAKIGAAIDELKVACISYWIASPSDIPINPVP